jgi:DNA mismatch endonuclease (patch repair protein)
MADVLSTELRSLNMSRIKSRDTRPELFVRSLLHRMGYRFRLHRSDLPGKPDIVLPRHKLIIFVHGCFWHRHKGCRFAYTPKSRVEFWECKLGGNVERDIRVRKALRKLGWRVVIVWECELRNAAKLEARLRRLFV